jgi:uncharacterized protein (DUF433 family)
MARVEIKPQVMVGKPVVKGTRIPVALILNLLAHGYSVERIIGAYPPLTKEDVRAALEYSEGILEREQVVVPEKITYAKTAAQR